MDWEEFIRRVDAGAETFKSRLEKLEEWRGKHGGHLIPSTDLEVWANSSDDRLEKLDKMAGDHYLELSTRLKKLESEQEVLSRRTSVRREETEALEKRVGELGELKFHAHGGSGLPVYPEVAPEPPHSKPKTCGECKFVENKLGVRGCWRKTEGRGWSENNTRQLACDKFEARGGVMEHQHLNCRDADCETCLDDAFRLRGYLEMAIPGGNRIDVLCQYRKWCDDNSIPAETEWGWLTEEFYSDENIVAFVVDWCGGGSDE